MAKNLYNLTEVTTVNNSDLLHVNQGSVSSDRKVTKQNLLKEVNSSINSLNSSLTNSLPTSAIVPITPTGCSNYANYGNSYYYKRGNQVFIHIGVQGLTPNSQTDVFTLPSGYRPYANFCAVGQGGESYLATSFMSIFSNGIIRITSSDHYAVIDGCFTVFS